MRDKHVTTVISKYQARSKTGIEKYGTTLERTDIDLHGWLKHLQEELMDATLYTERIMNDVSNQAQERQPSQAIAWTVRQLQSGPKRLEEIYPCTGGGFPPCHTPGFVLRTSIGTVHSPNLDW
jgi:hypothetical protein